MAYFKQVTNAIQRKSWHEDKITLELYQQIQQIWKGTPADFPIPIFQFPIFPELPTKGKPPAIDLAFSYRDDFVPRLFLGFECKKLYGDKGESIVQYIEEGMKRFIDRKYADDSDLGGMIGYVFDVDVHNVVTRINEKIRCDKRLRKRDCLTKNGRFIENYADDYISKHRRKTPLQEFLLWHLFLNFGN